MPRKPDYQALVPPNLGITVSNKEELMLHQKLFPEWIGYWECRKASAKQEIKQLQNLAKFFSDKSIADLRQISQNYESPAFSTFSSINGVYPPKYLFPDDDDSLRRKAGATTLRVCGWCSYARPQDGSPDCSCILRPVCILMSDELLATTTGGQGLSFHSPCALLRATDADISSCLLQLKAEQEILAKKRLRYASLAKKLQNFLAE